MHFNKKHITPDRYLTPSRNRAFKEKTKMKDTHKKEHIAIAKIVELIGSSPNSWEEATANAFEAASRSIRNITGVDVQHFTAKVKNNKIVEYRADLKIAFIVESE